VALRSIELFAGGGGLALGLEAVGARPVCFVERDAFAAATLVRQMEEGGLAPCPVWTDVATFDGLPWRGVVDLVSGGFPCQDISNAGKRVGIGGERSGLWSEFSRIVGEVRPSFVFVENVAALASRGLGVVLGDLAALGFDAEWGVFRASDAGAPHRRERLFILAHSPGVRQGAGERRSGDARGPTVASDCGCWDPNAWHRVYGMRPGERCGNAVADPYDRRPWTGRSESAGRPESRGQVQTMGNADGARLEGHGRGVRGGRPRRGHERERAPWPPGPDDAAGWRAYLERCPGTEPAVRRGADGLARRVDRLRVLGNGVVPQQAELAFRVLWDRLIGGRMTLTPVGTLNAGASR
jgi:DNA (cytosine-5)-methyltransferase 1